MSKKLGGFFNGTGADVYVCLGFIPDEVLMEDLELTTNALLRWNKNMLRTAEMAGGMIYTAASMAQDELVATEGISPYIGGAILTSTDAGTTTYGEGVYLVRDDNDYRYYSGNKSPGDAVAEDITDWTLDTAASNTGHFNEDANGTYIGEGSEIWIQTTNGNKFYKATITALTAAQGEAANEVTLSLSVPSGKVRYIGGKYGYRPMIAGEITKDGFKCDYAWTNDDTVSFIAEVWL